MIMSCGLPLYDPVSSHGHTLSMGGRVVLRVNRPTDAQTLIRTFVPSKPMVARIFNEGQLRGMDGHALARTDTIAAGDEVTLELRATRAAGPSSAAPVTVLYEDPILLAAEKPAGILVHGDGTVAETLTDRVQGHLAGEGSAAVPQALQRLDVDTSGIVLFSTAEELQPALDALISGDGLRKRYYAVIEGTLPRHAGPWLEVSAPIARDRHDARRMRVGRTGKEARTLLRTVAVRKGRSLVEAQLVTGRRHQIRVHLAHLGHPICGDSLYGGTPDDGGLLLHAHEAQLTHPLSGELLVVRSALPARLGTWGLA